LTVIFSVSPARSRGSIAALLLFMTSTWNPFGIQLDHVPGAPRRRWAQDPADCRARAELRRLVWRTEPTPRQGQTKLLARQPSALPYFEMPTAFFDAFDAFLASVKVDPGSRASVARLGGEFRLQVSH
jgi:hypothetical protein